MTTVGTACLRPYACYAIVEPQALLPCFHGGTPKFGESNHKTCCKEELCACSPNPLDKYRRENKLPMVLRWLDASTSISEALDWQRANPQSFYLPRHNSSGRNSWSVVVSEDLTQDFDSSFTAPPFRPVARRGCLGGTNTPGSFSHTEPSSKEYAGISRLQTEAPRHRHLLPPGPVSCGFSRSSSRCQGPASPDDSLPASPDASHSPYVALSPASVSIRAAGSVSPLLSVDFNQDRFTPPARNSVSPPSSCASQNTGQHRAWSLPENASSCTTNSTATSALAAPHPLRAHCQITARASPLAQASPCLDSAESDWWPEDKERLERIWRYGRWLEQSSSSRGSCRYEPTSTCYDQSAPEECNAARCEEPISKEGSRRRAEKKEFSVDEWSDREIEWNGREGEKQPETTRPHKRPRPAVDAPLIDLLRSSFAQSKCRWGSGFGSLRPELGGAADLPGAPETGGFGPKRE